MYNDARGCFIRIPLRILHKNVLLLVSFPVVTLVFLLIYSPLESSYTSVVVEKVDQQSVEAVQGTKIRQQAVRALEIQKRIAKDNKIEQNALQPVSTRRNTLEHVSIQQNALHANLDKQNAVEFVTIQSKSLSGVTFQDQAFTKDKIHAQGKAKNFTIHVWKHGERMKRRFLRSYGRTIKDPYAFCSVKNCQLSTNDSRVNDSDAVLFHLHQTLGPRSLPSHHPSHQIWIFFTDESPMHTFLATRKYTMKDYNGLFNWSMTYREDSDVPVPYGRTLPLTVAEKRTLTYTNYAASKHKGIAILGSNCGGQNHRWEYVEELQKYVTVDVYGGCGTHKCPGHFTRDCPLIGDYKFYLAFENSNCREYITEKLWWNAYHKETVPVVMGAPKSDYQKLCPPNSFIHTDDFKTPAELGKYLDFLMRNDTAYNSYFRWKKEYKVVNEHGYFGSPSLHLCRICEALNNVNTSSKPKTYLDLNAFWSSKSDCRKASWKPSS